MVSRICCFIAFMLKKFKDSDSLSLYASVNFKLLVWLAKNSVQY